MLLFVDNVMNSQDLKKIKNISHIAKKLPDSKKKYYLCGMEKVGKIHFRHMRRVSGVSTRRGVGVGFVEANENV